MIQSYDDLTDQISELEQEVIELRDALAIETREHDVTKYALEQALKRITMECPSCGEPVRGGMDECPACGMELSTSWSKGEQILMDREAAGQCECCGRPLEVCDADPCINEG